MKVIVVLMLGFTSVVTFTSDSSKAKGHDQKAALTQSASGLSVSLIAQNIGINDTSNSNSMLC